MSKITYTFPESSPVAELRGKTFSGGKFCRLDGKWQGEPDAVNFGEHTVGGKLVMLKAKIKGKPELEKALANYQAAQAAEAAILASIGWPQYQAVQSRAINAQGAYEAASQHGYPVKQAAAMREAEEALEAARAQYPLAAAYAKAESYSMASNDQKSSAGRKAMDAIKSGADPLQAVEKMKSDWSAAASKSCDNS